MEQLTQITVAETAQEADKIAAMLVKLGIPHYVSTHAEGTRLEVNGLVFEIPALTDLEYHEPELHFQGEYLMGAKFRKFARNAVGCIINQLLEA